MSNIVSQQEALELVDDPDVTFVDGSWYLPAQGRIGQAEYQEKRIPGAVFFDIDKIADPDTDLPHMLLHPDVFAEVVGYIGIASDNPIIVYDGPGMFSAPRVWWTLKTMGAKDVRILEDGFDHWCAQGLPVETGPPGKCQPAHFEVAFDEKRVATLDMMLANVDRKEALVIDARPIKRFMGKEPEPREGLRTGHIPGSRAVPAMLLVRDGRLVDEAIIEQHFDTLGISDNTPVITTCGSGVTAAILALVLEETGRTNYMLYDGSWAEWGKPDGPEVETSG